MIPWVTSPFAIDGNNNGVNNNRYAWEELMYHMILHAEGNPICLFDGGSFIVPEEAKLMFEEVEKVVGKFHWKISDNSHIPFDSIATPRCATTQFLFGPTKTEYIGYRVSLPYPYWFRWGYGYYDDFGLAPKYKVKIVYPDSSFEYANPNWTRGMGLWFVATNEEKYRNANFEVELVS
jgi:hypothetical protein